MMGYLQVLLASLVLQASANILSSNQGALPHGLSSVISDLEAEGVDQVGTVCLITSRSVTPSTRRVILQLLLGSGDAQKTCGTSSGLVLAQPDNCWEAADTVAQADAIFYYADPSDLRRGEGLFENLGPAMEHAASKDLYILTEEANSSVAPRFEEHAQRLLPNLVLDSGAASVQDLFGSLSYVSCSEAAAQVARRSAAAQESGASSQPNLRAPLSPPNLAAARRWGPASRRQEDNSLSQVVASCGEGDESTLVPEFGKLCQVALKQASLGTDNSPVAQELQANVLANLESSFSELQDKQMDLLEEACFDSFKKDLSKLLVSPNLGTEMTKTAQKSVRLFGKQARKLMFGAGSVTAQQTSFAKRLDEYVRQRLLAAQASGKFRPLPRKGVTVGLHWLLPKPFGNDYRQEPWMVHATDNLVYVPKDSKVSDVAPDDVVVGSWRDKIVPSPAGNDMLYMQ